MRIAGIDLSSFAIDIVFIEAAPAIPRARLFTYHYSLGKAGDAFDRARGVRDAMLDRDADIWQTVEAIGIEEPWGKGQISTAAGYRVQGAILACLPVDALVKPWSPAQWKKAAGIGGGADKARIREWAVEHYPEMVDFPLQDTADALGIAHATRVSLDA